jgi:hypothetical protein
MQREAHLAGLALYQQALRLPNAPTRKAHQHLDDLDIIIEEIQASDVNAVAAVPYRSAWQRLVRLPA